MGERARHSYSPHYTTTTRRNGHEERRSPEGTQRLRRAGQDHRHQEGRENLASSVHQASVGLPQGEGSPRSSAPRRERKSRVLSAPSVCGPTSRRRISRILRTSSGSPPTTPWHPSSEL